MTAPTEVTEHAPDTGPNVLRQRTGSRYGPPVAATPRKTPQRTIAIEDKLWDNLDVAARQAGYDRPTLIRAFVRWYLREPGARLPQRPGD